MSRDAKRKEKHRLKRKQKQFAHRKAKNVTALRKVALGGGTLECYVNPPDWEEEGIASIFVTARTPGGRSAVGMFLVDLWCVGLKDAWGRSESPPEDAETMRKSAVARGAVRMPTDVAKRLVAGGVRFSRENGFRLPDHWQKWVSVFGEMGPLESIDISDFGVEGEGTGTKLRYVGTEQFLRTRLTGCTMEQFMARPDVEVLIGEGPAGGFGDYEDDYDDEDDEADESLESPDMDEAAAGLADILSNTAAKTADEIRRWCFGQSIPPHPRLDEAAQVLLVALLPALAYADALAEGEVPEGEAPPEPAVAVEEAIAHYPPAEREDIRAAMDQVTRFMKSFDSPTQMLEAMGIPPVDQEEEEEAEEAR